MLKWPAYMLEQLALDGSEYGRHDTKELGIL
jgi:hypothetical protein